MEGNLIYIILWTIAGLAGGIVLGVLSTKKFLSKKILNADLQSQEILKEAKEKADKIIKDAERDLRVSEEKQREYERELKLRREELQRREERLIKKEENIEKKGDLLSGKEYEISKKEKQILLKEKEIQQDRVFLNEKSEEIKRKLEEIAGLSPEEAKKQLSNSLIEDVKLEAAKYIKDIEDEAKEEAEKRSKKIIATAIMRYAGEYSAEKSASVVQLPDDDMKGRIIGREGRNIKAFEAATGIDLVIDDTPEAVLLSGFNPVRREIARVSLEKLISDGRIHPSRIEEIVEKTKKEIEHNIKNAGEDALFELGITSVQPELVKILGTLKYRTSYGQNVLSHSIEVGFLCGFMAAELGQNVKEAKRAGLFHDIGKAVGQEIEGPHAIAGANILRKYGEAPEIIHAVAAHHEDEKPLTILAYLVASADALSGARPGARRESLESYIKRLEKLEEISKSFQGVEKCYAIQAGREIRIFVENTEVTDQQAAILARDIAKMIKEKLTYPGQIKVCVIRETRAIEYAK